MSSIVNCFTQLLRLVHGEGLGASGTASCSMVIGYDVAFVRMD